MTKRVGNIIIVPIMLFIYQLLYINKYYNFCNKPETSIVHFYNESVSEFPPSV